MWLPPYKSLVFEFQKNLNLWHKESMKLAMDFSQLILLPLKFPIYFLGNNMLFCLALYGSLKVTEFFGITTISHKLEEFVILQYLAPKNLILFGFFWQNEKTVSLRLEKLGMDIHYFELYNEDVLARSFQSIFFLQNMILLLAKTQGFNHAQYLLDKEKLRTSSDLIYK